MRPAGRPKSKMSHRGVGANNDELVEKMQGVGLIKSRRVAEAFRKTDRANYVSKGGEAYRDAPQSIGFGATISAPHMHAQAVEALIDYLEPGNKVLDIGCGSGYTTAVFTRLVSPSGTDGKVLGIEHLEGLVAKCVKNLETDGLHPRMDGPIDVVLGDGRKGYPLFAPYSAIHVGAAAVTIPQELIDQLASPGRMFIPVGEKGSQDGQAIWFVDKDENGNVTKEKGYSVSYVALTDAHVQWTEKNEHTRI